MYSFPLTLITKLSYTDSMKWNPANIKDLRAGLKLSQAAFGELLGVTRNYIAYLERGERIPSKTLMLLLDCIEEKKRKGERKGHGKGGL